jgi:hypothetical protein
MRREMRAMDDDLGAIERLILDWLLDRNKIRRTAAVNGGFGTDSGPSRGESPRSGISRFARVHRI